MVKKIVSGFFTFIVLFLCAVIVLRCCAGADRSVMTDLLPGEALTAALADGATEIYCLEHDAVEISPDGYFSAYAFRYIPACRQVQITVRYNVSLFKYMMIPEGSALSFYLGKNEDTENLIAPTYTETKETSLYHYQRLVFEDVEIGEDDVTLYLALPNDSYSACPVRYYPEQPLEPYKLSRAEKKAFGLS